MIVTCSPESVPQPLVDQLAEGGVIIIPIGQRYQQTLCRLTKTDGELVREDLRPTLFVPMTGSAEDERSVRPDPAHPKLVNEDFEAPNDQPQAVRPRGAPDAGVRAAFQPAITPGPDGLPSGELAVTPGPDGPRLGDSEPFIPGWYYGRQVRLVATDQGSMAVRFENSTPGLASHLMQGLAVDGRIVPRMRLAISVKTDAVEVGPQSDQLPMATVTFYDEMRREVGYAALGPYGGTQQWRLESRLVGVPPAAREAIVRLGMFGATGAAEFDFVRLEPPLTRQTTAAPKADGQSASRTSGATRDQRRPGPGGCPVTGTIISRGALAWTVARLGLTSGVATVVWFQHRLAETSSPSRRASRAGGSPPRFTVGGEG